MTCYMKKKKKEEEKAASNSSQNQGFKLLHIQTWIGMEIVFQTFPKIKFKETHKLSWG